METTGAEIVFSAPTEAANAHAATATKFLENSLGGHLPNIGAIINSGLGRALGTVAVGFGFFAIVREAFKTMTSGKSKLALKTS